MTRDEILAIVPSRDMDALIAEKVMDKRVVFDKPWGWMYAEQETNIWTNVKHYSTHMLSAMEIVEYLRTKGCGFQLKMDNIIWAEFYGLGLGYFTCTGETPSEAICKSALLVASNKNMWYGE